jgi:hypothetical protein
MRSNNHVALVFISTIGFCAAATLYLSVDQKMNFTSPAKSWDKKSCYEACFLLLWGTPITLPSCPALKMTDLMKVLHIENSTVANDSLDVIATEDTCHCANIASYDQHSPGHSRCSDPFALAEALRQALNLTGENPDLGYTSSALVQYMGTRPNNPDPQLSASIIFKSHPLGFCATQCGDRLNSFFGPKGLVDFKLCDDATSCTKPFWFPLEVMDNGGERCVCEIIFQFPKLNKTEWKANDCRQNLGRALTRSDGDLRTSTVVFDLF